MSNNANNANRTPIPTEWSEHYTQSDTDRCKTILALAKDNQIPHARLAKMAGVKQGTLSSVLNGKYNAVVTQWVDKIESALMHFLESSDSADNPFVETSVAKLVNVVCDRTRKNRDFGVIAGWVGTGKTYALKQYVALHQHTVLIEANPSMTAKLLLADILDELGLPLIKRFAGKPNQEDYFSSVLEGVKGTSILIVLDEADTVSPGCLAYLRRLRDKGNIGIILAGTEHLISTLKASNGQFDQVRSRVSFWPDTIRGVKKVDQKLLVESLLPDHELSPAILDAFWRYTQGSARMLCESLIPALKDFGLKDYELSPELIEKVAHDVLGLRANN